MDGVGVTSAAAIVDALANDPVTDVLLELSTANSLSRLAVGAATSTVNVGGAGSAKLLLSGPLGAVRQALQTHEYMSPDRFFGVDTLNGEGTWFGSPGATPVCDATRQHSICGIIENLTTSAFQHRCPWQGR